MTRTVVIWNPASGGSPTESELRDAVGDDAEIVETTADDPGAGQAEQAISSGATSLVACGGDGTVRAALAALAGTETALSVLPTGTGNLLAANLGLANGVEAADGIGKGPRRHLDIGWLNGEAFAVMAGSGFDARMIRGADEDLKARLGTTAYVLSGLRRLRSGLTGTIVEVDGARWFDGPTSMVLVGNFSTISGGVDLFPDAEPDDGRLDMIVLSASTVRDWARVAWHVLRGTGLPDDLGQRTRGERILVTLDRPRRYELDGEDRVPTDRLEFAIQHAAIVVRQEGT